MPHEEWSVIITVLNEVDKNIHIAVHEKIFSEQNIETNSRIVESSEEVW
jgi:hypothetical protein